MPSAKSKWDYSTNRLRSLHWGILNLSWLQSLSSYARPFHLIARASMYRFFIKSMLCKYIPTSIDRQGCNWPTIWPTSFWEIFNSLLRKELKWQGRSRSSSKIRPELDSTGSITFRQAICLLSLQHWNIQIFSCPLFRRLRSVCAGFWMMIYFHWTRLKSQHKKD